MEDYIRCITSFGTREVIFLQAKSLENPAHADGIFSAKMDTLILKYFAVHTPSFAQPYAAFQR
jgi:hypothetical protein